MLLLRILLPLLYCYIMAGAYGVLFKKNIYDSLAPALFLQIILCFSTSIIFSSFTLGLVAGAVCAILVMAIVSVKNRDISGVMQYYKIIPGNSGILMFLFLYLVVYISNYGKFFFEWDEFSHWGIFVKEILRLDTLYCTSTAPMVHRDYVPAISLFEAIWCKLSMRFSEADTYRGIQILQMSMMFPLLGIKSDTNKKSSIFSYIARTVIVFGVPLFFGRFYSTIYQDLIYGIILYYCMYVIVRETEGRYKCFLLTISLTVLVLSKMTAVAFLPMIVLFYVVYERKFTNVGIKSLLIRTGISFTVPFAFWAWYEHFVKASRAGSAGIQSYTGLNMEKILGTILHNGVVPYQGEVESLFLKYLFTEAVVQRISYIFWVLMIIFALVWLKKCRQDETEKRKISLVTLWIALASVAYAAMMYFLYLNCFSEFEAKYLASYPRYMATMLMAITFITIAMYFLYDDLGTSRMITIIAFVVLENILFFIGVDQLKPGGSDYSPEFISEAEAIDRNASNDESVYIVSCGDTGAIGTIIRYRCSPRSVDWGSLGKPRYEGDVWSNDLGSKECFELLSKYDFVYLLEIDNIFLEEYSDLFINPEVIKEHTLYKISIINDKIELNAT